ncbi:hypothetical protein [Campylobacter pinnipediorum]|uniref:hypothetical protein n=1 Tax=Campylobacter pinnipediorum TaxID=1965231 RepID=UPI00084D9609|nr:hypothetical protein [Campylobacter pinnipediorum]AQW80653.1 hypothetical protein CPIN17260_0317 [Campylobacter pinnipediorum subsp. pinnipediorum]AQW83993.1 hypothetical protein CPIN17262_0272 [Campylobacter pinnipediorum subsp. pinnipediorum]
MNFIHNKDKKSKDKILNKHKTLKTKGIVSFMIDIKYEFSISAKFKKYNHTKLAALKTIKKFKKIMHKYLKYIYAIFMFICI